MWSRRWLYWWNRFPWTLASLTPALLRSWPLYVVVSIFRLIYMYVFDSGFVDSNDCASSTLRGSCGQIGWRVSTAHLVTDRASAECLEATQEEEGEAFFLRLKVMDHHYQQKLPLALLLPKARPRAACTALALHHPRPRLCPHRPHPQHYRWRLRLRPHRRQQQQHRRRRRRCRHQEHQLLLLLLLWRRRQRWRRRRQPPAVVLRGHHRKSFLWVGPRIQSAASAGGTTW